MEQAEVHSRQLVDVEVSTYPFLLNMKTEISGGNHAKAETKKESHTKILSKNKTPIMLLTTSTSPGRERSPVSIALRRDCLDCIESRCSAPLRRVTMNSVIEKGSSVPNTVEAVFCTQRLSNLTSKVG